MKYHSFPIFHSLKIHHQQNGKARSSWNLASADINRIYSKRLSITPGNERSMQAYTREQTQSDVHMVEKCLRQGSRGPAVSKMRHWDTG